ncbi:MAG TPA: ATP-binding protein [Thermoanaerobaculia bacterium]|nr:ATP-binding protein [Thermoanaerobaculia bacterium]
MILADLLQDQNPWWRDGAIRRARGYPVRRELQPKILNRILRMDDRRATVLLGPRQVGKTVLLLQLADDLLAEGLPAQNLTYFDFSDERITGEIMAHEVVEALPVGVSAEYPRVFLFDEIRSAPKWDLWLKRAVDARVGRIVATDSAARLLRDGTQESGQGRWDEIYIEGLTFREFVQLHGGPEQDVEKVLRLAPNLHERYLALGGFPEYVLSDDFPEVRRRLRSDIAERAILRDLSGLGVDVERVKDLFVYLLQDSGAEFNAEARARDLGADARSVRDWSRLLADTLLVSPLDRFNRNAAAGLRSKSKIFAADPGLVAAFAPLPVQDPNVRGRAFEAAVFRHLREAARQLEGRLTYFRHREDLEIDFVFEGAGGVVAVEVTSGPRLRADKAERLRRAAKELGADRRLLIHGGVIEETAEGVEAVALQRFLLDPVACLQGGFS